MLTNNLLPKNYNIKKKKSYKSKIQSNKFKFKAKIL